MAMTFNTKGTIHEEDNWQLNFINFKNFCTEKDNVKGTRR